MPINPNAAMEVTALAWVPAAGTGAGQGPAGAMGAGGSRVRLPGAPARRRAPVRLLKEQAFNQVPSFRDGAVQFFESGAIVQYIGEKSEALLPRDPQGKYRAIQWSYAAVNSVEPAVQNRVLLDSFYADEEWAKLYTPTADQFARLRLKRVSERLAGNLWLEGDRFTMGDLMMITVLRLADCGGLLGDTPNLAEYMERGQTRPAFQTALDDQLATYRVNEPKGEAA